MALILSVIIMKILNLDESRFGIHQIDSASFLDFNEINPNLDLQSKKFL